jgi:DNA polymerase IV
MILHVDMDAFYASVEQREQPDLAGQPVIVGGAAEGRGVVCAANYVARRYGIHSAMPMARAIKLCPQAVRINPRMEFYGKISQQIREIFHRYSPLVEPLSLDEAFLDVRGSQQLFGTAETIGRRIQTDISTELNLPASVGVAPNKFLAKLASDLEKPKGFVVVPSDTINEFLDPLEIERLWGVGRVTCEKLHGLGLRTIGQLRQRTPDWLQRNLGNVGQHLWNLASGIDDRSVVPSREAKSISHETTFATDIEDSELLRTWLLELTEQVAWRVRKQQLSARTIHLKLRYSDFHTITRSQSVESPTDVTDVFWRTVDQLFCERLPPRRLCVRLIGMGVSGFEPNRKQQQMLFGEETDGRLSQLDQVTDNIRARFGSKALKRGRGVSE